MSKLKISPLNEIFESQLSRKLNSRYSLFIVLGLLGDFDSIEYIQNLVRIYKNLVVADIELIVFGIGSKQSKVKFCDYTKLDMNCLFCLDSNELHKTLGLYSGPNFGLNSYLSLFLMCLGIQSPGTLAEVFRGYLGDNTSKKVFYNDELIQFTNFIKFNSKSFDLLGKDGSLRPFELASLRLMNMIEVLSSWDLYMKKSSYLTQRGGTFLLNKKSELIYSYKTKSLLSYSSNMSRPLHFLDNYLL